MATPQHGPRQSLTIPRLSGTQAMQTAYLEMLASRRAASRLLELLNAHEGQHGEETLHP